MQVQIPYKISTVKISTIKMSLIELAPSTLFLVGGAIKFLAVELVGNVKDYGLLRGVLLHILLFQAKQVIRRVRTPVLGDGVAQAKEAIILKESYNGSLSMVAVAVSVAHTAIMLLLTMSRQLFSHKSPSPRCRYRTLSERIGPRKQPSSSVSSLGFCQCTMLAPCI